LWVLDTFSVRGFVFFFVAAVFTAIMGWVPFYQDFKGQWMNGWNITEIRGREQAKKYSTN
jgi:hypothetical protein